MVPLIIMQVIEIAGAVVRCGGSSGGLRRLRKAERNQCAAVLRWLVVVFPHTPYALDGALELRPSVKSFWRATPSFHMEQSWSVG